MTGARRYLRSLCGPLFEVLIATVARGRLGREGAGSLKPEICESEPLASLRETVRVAWALAATAGS